MPQWRSLERMMNTHPMNHAPGFQRAAAVVQSVGWPIEGLDEGLDEGMLAPAARSTLAAKFA
jgi:hypothetical protein